MTEKTLVSNSEQRLRSVLSTLEQCRTILAEGGNRETAQLVSVAVLGLRMKLNGIADSELKALCDAMFREQDASRENSQDPRSPQGPRRGPMLKLVK